MLLRLPAGSASRDPQLTALIVAARAAPDDLAAALALARHYADLGRSAQDTRLMGYAQAALAKWWDLPEPPPAVRAVRAAVFQHRHRFDDAVAELDLLLVTDPTDAAALLGRAQVLMVVGRPAEAAESCEKLIRVARQAALVCVGKVRALTGQAEMSRAMLRRALAGQATGSPGWRAWTLAALADVEWGRGDLQAAQGHLAEAHALDPRDAWVTNALADVLIELGQPAAAQAVLGKDVQNDGTLLRMVLAGHALGQDVTGSAAILLARFAAGRERQDGTAQREEARYHLAVGGNPRLALERAADNWRTQREVEDARLLLATALAAGEPAAARPVLDWLTQTGLVDARLEPLRRQLVGGPP